MKKTKPNINKQWQYPKKSINRPEFSETIWNWETWLLLTWGTGSQKYVTKLQENGTDYMEGGK